MTRIIESLKQAVRHARGDKSAAHSTLVLDTTHQTGARIKQMVSDSGLKNTTEVVSAALRLYEACLKEVNAGGTVIVRRADGTEIEAMGGDDE